MTCAASTSEMIGVDLFLGELRGCFAAGSCASTIADAIAQIRRVALSITISRAKATTSTNVLTEQGELFNG